MARARHEGRTHSFTGANVDFESRPLPIYIAARGPRLLQLAGEVADGVIIGSRLLQLIGKGDDLAPLGAFIQELRQRLDK